MFQNYRTCTVRRPIPAPLYHTKLVFFSFFFLHSAEGFSISYCATNSVQKWLPCGREMDRASGESFREGNDKRMQCKWGEYCGESLFIIAVWNKSSIWRAQLQKQINMFWILGDTFKWSSFEKDQVTYYIDAKKKNTSKHCFCSVTIRLCFCNQIFHGVIWVFLRMSHILTQWMT